MSSAKADPSSTLPSVIPEIPNGYADGSENVDWMSDCITPGSNVICVPAQINTFNCFYVSSYGHWALLTKFMEDFDKEYKSLPLSADSIPHPKRLKAGLYVAVAFALPNRNAEYNRALILEVLHKRKKDKYKVFLIDFGDIITVRINDIKYIKREFLDRLPAQAIECRAYLSSAYSNTSWKQSEMAVFRNEIFQKTLGVDFLKRTDEITYSKYGSKWLVSTDIVEHKSFGQWEVIKQNIEQLAISEFRGFYLDSDSEDKAERKYNNLRPPPLF